MKKGGLFSSLANPVSMMGMGLLGQGRSLTPINPLQGLGAGLGMYGQMQQAQADKARQAMAAQTLAMQQQKMEQDQAARESRSAAISSLPPDLQQLAAIDPGVAAKSYAASIAPPEPPDLPGAVEEALWYQTATPEERAAFEATRAARRAPAANITNVVGGDAGFDPKTQMGKLLVDLQAVQSMPDSPERAAAETAIRAGLAKASQPSAEVAGREEKYGAALDAAERFVATAEANEGSVGPIQGRMARIGGLSGFGSPESADLAAMEATMRSQLGTALSGAAIPPSEWPTYMAQIPTMNDKPKARRNKLNRLREMVSGLKDRRAESMGSAPEAATSIADANASEADIMAAYGIAP